jgi:hypothetical protein
VGRLGGGHRKTSRQEGGNLDTQSMFRQMDENEYTCGVEIGAF